MTQEQFLADAGMWLANVTFFTSLAFPLATAVFWPWWASWWGRNIVSLELGIAVTLLPAVLFRDFGVDSLVLRWVQAAALATVPLIVVWRAVMIWQTQRAGALGGRRLRDDVDVRRGLAAHADQRRGAGGRAVRAGAGVRVGVTGAPAPRAAEVQPAEPARRVVVRLLRAAARPWREAWRDIVHLCATGQLRPGR